MTWWLFLPLACWWPPWWLERSCPASARTPVRESKTRLAGRKERTSQKAFRFWWNGQQRSTHHNCSFCARFSVFSLLVLLHNCSFCARFSGFSLLVLLHNCSFCARFSVFSLLVLLRNCSLCDRFSVFSPLVLLRNCSFCARLSVFLWLELLCPEP